jgi:transcriptional regulator with XRE-family HTH domain
MDFINVLKRCMDERGKKQVDLSDKLKLTPSYISGLLNRKTKAPVYENTKQISELLELNRHDEITLLELAWQDRWDESDWAYFKDIGYVRKDLMQDRISNQNKMEGLQEIISGLEDLPEQKRKLAIEAFKSIIMGMK